MTIATETGRVTHPVRGTRIAPNMAGRTVDHRTTARAGARALTSEQVGMTLSLWTRLAIGLATAVVLFAGAAGSAFAHHGWTGYDSNTLLVLSGRIVEVDYRNPHVQVVLEVPAEPEADGTVEDPPEYLLVVMAPPARSEGRGLAREMLRVGATATAEGYLHQTQDRELRAERITIDDTTVELR